MSYLPKRALSFHWPYIYSEKVQHKLFRSLLIFCLHIKLADTILFEHLNIFWIQYLYLHVYKSEKHKLCF